MERKAACASNPLPRLSSAISNARNPIPAQRPMRRISPAESRKGPKPGRSLPPHGHETACGGEVSGRSGTGVISWGVHRRAAERDVARIHRLTPNPKARPRSTAPGRLPFVHAYGLPQPCADAMVVVPVRRPGSRCRQRDQNSNRAFRLKVRPTGAIHEAIDPSGCARTGMRSSRSRRLRTLSCTRRRTLSLKIFRV